ncbi:MAG: Gldg family protein, partial [Clostridia bacterium]|nr:Gldg family protein [Clostridia bacterium]
MKKKQLPFGLYNALLCLMAAIIFVLGVMCVQAAEEKWYLKIDLSDDGVSRLSDYTRSRLEALEEDVTLHIIHSYGIASDLYDLQSETLMKMAAECPRITVETIDPAAQPHLLLELAGDTAGIPEGTVFVRNQQGSRTVRIDAEEFIFARRIGADQYTIYCGEAMLIGGIDRAVDEDPAAVWFITGHGEAEEAATAQLRLQLSAMGLEVRSGVLAMIQPQPGDVLALIAPETDLTDGEAAALKNHLNSGVHLLAACGADTPIDRLPNLTALMDLYGLGWRSGWAVESPEHTAYFVDETALLSHLLAEGNGVLDA